MEERFAKVFGETVEGTLEALKDERRSEGGKGKKD